MLDSPTYSAYDDLPPDAALVDAGLDRFNADAAPLQHVRPLACLAHLTSGQAIGGAVGRTWGACCELQQLWVHPVHRRRGVGARLVETFERRARERGCRTFFLETFSFQSPQLYRRLGYQVRLELRGFPDGIVKYLMVREAGD